jgi:hypothetical protein
VSTGGKSESDNDKSGSAKEKCWSTADNPWSTNDKPGGTSNFCKAVWENHIIFGNVSGVAGSHSYYLSFNDFLNACIQFVFSSIYLYSSPSTKDISGLDAGVACWQLMEHWKQRIK